MEDNKGLMILDACYKKVLEGIPLVNEPVEELADSYLKKAIEELVSWQIRKCATSGFLTGLGGFITLPVTIPANISSILYV